MAASCTGVPGTAVAARRGGMVQRNPRWLSRPEPALFAAILMVATLIALALITAAPADATTPAVESDDTRFPVDISAAMGKMMVAMDFKPSVDVDADFVAAVIPHHQGAIDMAQAEQPYGRNEQ